MEENTRNYILTFFQAKMTHGPFLQYVQTACFFYILTYSVTVFYSVTIKFKRFARTCLLAAQTENFK